MHEGYYSYKIREVLELVSKKRHVPVEFFTHFSGVSLVIASFRHSRSWARRGAGRTVRQARFSCSRHSTDLHNRCIIRRSACDAHRFPKRHLERRLAWSVSLPKAGRRSRHHYAKIKTFRMRPRCEIRIICVCCAGRASGVGENLLSACFCFVFTTQHVCNVVCGRTFLFVPTHARRKKRSPFL